MKISIINSVGHWKNGWLSSPQDLQFFIESLHRSGFSTEVFEVNSLSALEQILKNCSPDNLILPNAYYVDSYEGSAEKVWMVEVIESFGLPFIGSNSQTLRNVLQKDVCQRILKAHGIPVPEFTVIPCEQAGNEKAILDASAVTYPAVVKLTNESGSMGMDDSSLVYNQDEAIRRIQCMLQQYQRDIIIEEFLPSNDLTIGYYQGKNGTNLLLTTWYLVTNKPGHANIMGPKERFMLWGGPKKMTPVQDAHILEQVERLIPKVCEILNIKDVTRVDGRLDKNGRLKIFDVNGFPALVFPESVSIQQGLVSFPDQDKRHVYDAIVCTIISNAANRYHLSLPNLADTPDLFALKTKESEVSMPGGNMREVSAGVSPFATDSNPGGYAKTPMPEFIEQITFPNYTELNKALQPILMEWSETRPDRRLGGNHVTFFQLETSWHSHDNLHEIEPFHGLRDFIEAAVYEKLHKQLKVFSMWSIIGKKGTAGKRHDHLGLVSGVYYIDNGHYADETITGKINFHSDAGIKAFEPKIGNLFLFPANLEHHVDAFLGAKHRIVVAFNLQ